MRHEEIGDTEAAQACHDRGDKHGEAHPGKEGLYDPDGREQRRLPEVRLHHQERDDNDERADRYAERGYLAVLEA